MIMKANKQIGFIYKNEESIDKILKDGDVVFEKGFLREKTSTTLPINFGGVGKDLKNYKIYGNTVQNGTPTPDAPIEMVSCGDKTSNLFSSKMELGTINDSGQNANSENAIRTKDYIEVNPNTTYTMSNDKNYRIFLYQYDENNDYVTHSNNYGGYITFTTASNTKYVKARTNAGTIENDLTSLWKLAEGSTVTPYEPYGYKIPVNVRSENLCDGINKKYWLSTTVLSAGMADGNSGLAIELKENTNYTISTQIIQERYRVALINTLPTSGTGIPCYNGVKKDGTKDNITISSSQYKYLILNATDLTKCQIVEGSTAPSKYIPYYNETTNIYLDEPLRKIDGYSDYIDFINGKVVRNIKEIVLNGTENNPNINTSQTNTVRLLYSNLLVNNKSIANNPNVISNYLIGKIMWNEDSQGIYTNTNDMVIRINKSIIGTTINEINAWITEHNIEACYPLSTPTEEDIELPSIPTVEGNNTLNIETEITPSQVYIKYKSNT